MHAFDRQTDGRTDGRTDGQTEVPSLYRDCIPCSAVKTVGDTQLSPEMVIKICEIRPKR